MKPVIRQLFFLFILNLILAFLVKGITDFVGFKNGLISFEHTQMIFSGKIGTDSWQPMKLAYDHWIESQGQSLLYTDLLINHKVKVKFQYPPTTLLITQFIERNHINQLNFSIATTLIFLFLMILSVIVTTLYSYREYKAHQLSITEEVIVGVLLTLLFFMFYPVVKAATLGQIQVWLNSIFALAILCYITGYETAAGILLGIMASIKPQYALFVLWGLFRGNNRLVIAMIVTGALGLLLGIHEFGFSMYLDYLRGLSYLAQHGESHHSNQSFNGLIGRLYSLRYPDLFNNTEWLNYQFPPYNIWVFTFTQITTIAILLISLIKTKSRQIEARLADFLLMGLGATLASPIAWEHHYGILFPIFTCVWLVLWFGESPLNQTWAKIVFVVCYLFAANEMPFTELLANSYLNILQSYLFFAACGVFILLILIKHEFKFIPTTQ